MDIFIKKLWAYLNPLIGHFELKRVLCKNKVVKNKYQLIFYIKYLIISLL
jgi:hypothetical protein